MAYDKPEKTKSLTKAFEQRATTKRHKNSKKRLRMKSDKMYRGKSFRPATHDKKALQARRWLRNKLRKPTNGMDETATAQFNRWTNHPDEFILKLQLLGPTKTVPHPAALAMMHRFIKERDVALEAQGVEEGAQDWWEEVKSRKQRDDDEAWRVLVEDSGTTNPDDWRREKLDVEEEGRAVSEAIDDEIL